MGAIADPKNLKFRLGFNASILACPKIRGLTRHTLNLIEAVHNAAPQVEIFLYSNRELSPSLLRRLPFAQPRVMPLRPDLLWEQVGLPLQLGWDSIDIFHSTLNTGIPFFRPFYTSTVQTVHDVFDHESVGHLPANLELESWKKFMGFWPRWGAALTADLMIAVSDASKQEIVDRYPSTERKIRILPNAVDPIFFAGNADPGILSRFGLSQGYILYVGGFEERKNVGCLVEAYKKFRERAKNFPVIPQLVLIGASEKIPAQLSQAIDRTPGVAMLAYCTDEVLRELYRGAIFGVFPSQKEGFGFPALEFGSAGTATILSDIPIFHEIAEDAAPYFDPNDNDALADLIWHMWREPDWRGNWAKKLMLAAQQNTWQKIAQSTLDAYDGLLRS